MYPGGRVTLMVLPEEYELDVVNLNWYVDAFPTVLVLREVTLGDVGEEGVKIGAAGNTTLPNSRLQTD